MLNQPLVSVLIPCYDAERCVGEGIESALDQTYPNVEVIVLDDGSTDGSLEVIRSFGDRIRWETGPNRGQSAARNRLLALSRGEWVQYLDADDVLSPQKVERQVVTALAHAGAVVYGPFRRVWVDQRGGCCIEEAREAAIPAGCDLLEVHLRGSLAPLHAFLFPRALFDVIGGWDEALDADEDGDLLMRAILAGFSFVYCPESWVDYVHLPRVSVSSRMTVSSIGSRIRVIRKVEHKLREQGRYDLYREALAWRYEFNSRNYWQSCPREAAWCAQEARRMWPKGPQVGAWHYRMVRRVFGFRCAEWLAALWRCLWTRVAS